MRPAIPWSQAGWLDEARAWIHQRVEQLGRHVTGPLEQPHTYPWSTVLHVPTDQGKVYFKAVSGLDPHEVPLNLALAEWRPDCTLRVLASDIDRG